MKTPPFQLSLFVPFVLLVFYSMMGAARAQGGGDAERAFSRGDKVPAWVTPAGPLPPASTGVALSIRLADLQLYASDQSTMYQHRALTAHEASQLGALGQFEIEFQPEYQRVQLHTLRLLRGRESIDKLKAASIRFLQRETELDRGIYSGTVTAAVVTEDVRVGDTLEIEYSVVGQNPVFDGAFFQAAQWDYSHPVSRRRVILNAADARPVHYRVIGADSRPLPAPTEVREDGRRILTFEASKLQPLLGEPAIPSDVHAYRWIQFSEYDSWSTVNDWAQRLFAQKTNPAVLQGPLKAARAARTQAEAVTRVLEFVQSEIRYLSVSLGENSHRPYPPEQVLERRYGDCKDKSLLMVAMLRELKIEAAPVLVATYSRKGIDQMLPSPILFDHAIVRVTLNGKTYFLDPTRMGQHGLLDRMGQAHGGNQVLAIAPGTKGLSTIPLAADPLGTKRIERVTVTAPDQPVEMTVRLEMRGTDSEYARVQLASMSKEELRKSFDSFLVKRYPDAQLQGEPGISDDPANNTLNMELRYRIDTLFTASDDSWTMRYAPTNLAEVFNPTGSARRQFAYAIPNAPSRLVYEFEMTVPPGYEASPGTKTTRVDNPGFVFVHVSTVGGRSYRSSASLDLLADRVAPAAMPAFLADMQKMNEGMSGVFRIFRNEQRKAAATPSEQASAAASPAAAPASVEAQLRATLAGINRAVADTELAGRDSSAALCERALTRAYLGETADALKDAARAVQLQPQSLDMLRCRADTELTAGKFKESESDFGKAIARGAGDADSYFGRALAALFQDKAGNARDDFALSAGKAEGAQRTRALIWQAIAAQQESGAPAPAAAEGASAPAPETAWLSAVPGMFNGSYTPEHIVGLASRNAGRELDARLTEAYYYCGKYYLLKRDKLRARAFLQRAADKKVLNNLYNVTARHELQRMEK